MTNAKSTYNKVEHVFLDVKIDNKFYLYEHFPCSVIESLFGNDLSKFDKHERVSKSNDNKSATFHVFSRQRTNNILTTMDVNLAQFTSYKVFEINHYLCSYAIIAPVAQDGATSTASESSRIKCYGWDEHGEDGNKLVEFHFNNFDNTALSQATFHFPIHEKTVVFRDGKEKVRYEYVFYNRRSLCGMYGIVYFCPVVFHISMNKLTLKFIASRACKKLNCDAFEKNISS